MKALIPALLALVALCASAAAAAAPEPAPTTATADTEKSPSTEPAAGTLTLSELADRYEQTQNKLQSFVMAIEVRRRTERAYQGQAIGQAREEAYEFDVRSDGKSTKLVTRGFVPPAHDKRDAEPKTSPFRSRLWDGKDYYDYAGPVEPNELGHLTLTQHVTPEAARVDARWVIGWAVPWRWTLDPFGLLREPLSSLRSGSLRRETEQVNGLNCYVVDIPVEGGNMTLWVDPEHGYHILKSHVDTASGANRFSREPKVKRFEQFDGVWVPVELAISERQEIGPDMVSSTEATIKVTKLTLNPDHEALRSFLPDEIPNGTRVEVAGDEKFVYRWQNGELIPYLFRTRGTGRVKGSVAAGGTLRFPSQPTQPAGKDSSP